MTSPPQLAPQQRTRRRANWSDAAREGVAAKIEALWSDHAYRERMCAAMREGHARKKARLARSFTS